MPEPAEENERKCGNKPNGVDYWTAGVLTVTMIAVIIYAGLTYRLLTIGQAQLNEAQRAWLGLSDKQIKTSQPVFSDGQFLQMQIAYEVQNYSDSTASKEFDGAVAIAPINQGAAPIISANDPRSPCGTEGQRTDASGILITTGQAIFPDAIAGRIVNSVTALPPGVTSFTNLWISVCIVYRDQNDNLHHTRFLYRSNFKPDDKPVQQGSLSYMPVLNWQLWDSRVD